MTAKKPTTLTLKIQPAMRRQIEKVAHALSRATGKKRECLERDLATLRDGLAPGAATAEVTIPRKAERKRPPKSWYPIRRVQGGAPGLRSQKRQKP